MLGIVYKSNALMIRNNANWYNVKKPLAVSSTYTSSDYLKFPLQLEMTSETVFYVGLGYSCLFTKCINFVSDDN